VLAIGAVCASMTRAKVWVTAYRCDERTPLQTIDPNHPTVYRDIMVGTRLVLVVTSDAPGLVGDYLLWSGALQISRDDWQRGTLTGRGYNERWLAYQGSCLPAAGRPNKPAVWYRESPNTVGFEFGVGLPSVAGDWFVLDYHAQQVGTCTVDLHAHSADSDPVIQTLSFTHVPSADFNDDTVVNFQDLALLASRWGAKADPNSPAAAFDLNADHQINLGDLALFSAYWLEPTDCSKAATDPNKPL